jgi:hypothetical protein
MRKFTYIKVVPQQKAGRPHVVIDDHLVAVCDDGTEVDISSAVTAWRLVSKVGEARLLELDIICSVVDPLTEVTAALDKPEPLREARVALERP